MKNGMCRSTYLLHLFTSDYIDATVSNALAFRIAEYSFIGITMPLINTLWDACVELNKSYGVRALLEVPDTPEFEEAILTVMFQTQLTFVVTHEYTHHVHGHFSQRAPASTLFNEVIGDTNGKLEDQAFELDADGYAVYHVLAHLIAGPRRDQAIRILGCEHSHSSVQDEILFSLFVMSVAAFLYILASCVVGPFRTVQSHPPTSGRKDALGYEQCD